MSSYALPFPARIPAKGEGHLPLPRRAWKKALDDFIRFASGKSNVAAKATADAWYGSTTLGPATVFFGLWTAALSASSTGSTASEANYTGYARVGLTNNSTNFPAATGTTSATKQNATAVTFAQNTGASNTIVSGATLTASSAGNITNWGDISSTVINTNDTPQIAINGFTLTES